MKNVWIKKISFGLMTFVLCTVLINAQNLNETYDGVEFLDVSTVTGDITIKKGNSKTIKVKGEWDTDEVKVRVSHTGKSLTIEEKSLGNNTDSDASNWVLMIPDGLDIGMNSGTGDLDISGVNGDLEANTGTGSIQVADMEGRFDVNSGTGSIDINNAKGRFRLNSGTSDVVVMNAEGRFDANSGTGDVEFKMVNPTGNSTLNSGTGDVEFVVAGKIAADLALNSGTGDATLDFHGNKIDGDIEMKCGLRRGTIVAPFDFDTERKIGYGNNGHIEKTVTIGSGEYDVEISTGTGTAEIKS